MEKSEMESMCKEMFFKTLDNIINLNVEVKCEPVCEPVIRKGDPSINISVRVKRMIPPADQVENSLRNVLKHIPEK